MALWWKGVYKNTSPRFSTFPESESMSVAHWSVESVAGNRKLLREQRPLEEHSVTGLGCGVASLLFEESPWSVVGCSAGCAVGVGYGSWSNI